MMKPFNYGSIEIFCRTKSKVSGPEHSSGRDNSVGR